MAVEFAKDINSPEEALRAIRIVSEFCRSNRDNIDSIPGLMDAVRDLGQAQRVLADTDNAALFGRDGGVGGSLKAMVQEYTIRADELGGGQSLRKYNAGGKAVQEEVGGIRLFGRSYTNDDGHGVETDYVPGLLDDTAPVTEAQRELQSCWSKRAFMQAFQRSVKPGVPTRTPAMDRKIQRIVKSMGTEVARAFADASGVGAEWIPDDFIPTVESYVKHNRQVASLFREIPVARDTALLPYLSAGFIPYIHGEVDGDDPAQIKSSSMTTAQRTIQSKTLAVRAQLGDNASEDTLLPFMDIIMQEGGFALLSGEEDAIINGDTSSTHQDTGIASWNPDSFYPAAPGGLSIDHRRICDGLRRRSFSVSNTTDRGTFTLATFAADAGSLVGPKQGPADAVVLTNNYILATKILVLDQVVTREKYGDGAAIQTGEVARLLGRPVIPSQFLTADMNASGIYDGTTTTKGGIIQVLRGRFIRAVRRGVTVEFQRDATRGVTHVIWKMRGLPIKAIGSATEKSSHFAFNMA